MPKYNPYKQRRKSSKPVSILLMHLPPETDRDIAFSMSYYEKPLIKVICDVAADFRRKGVSVVERRNNVIETAIGFYYTVYEQDVVDVEGGKYKGEEDGEKTNQ